MKALTAYPEREGNLRKLFRKVSDKGEINCDFPTFSKLYEEWHKISFPNSKINTMLAIVSDDLFLDFVNFLSNKDI